MLVHRMRASERCCHSPESHASEVSSLQPCALLALPCAFFASICRCCNARSARVLGHVTLMSHRVMRVLRIHSVSATITLPACCDVYDLSVWPSLWSDWFSSSFNRPVSISVTAQLFWDVYPSLRLFTRRLLRAPSSDWQTKHYIC